LLFYLDNSLKSNILPAIMSVGEEYFVKTVDITCPPNPGGANLYNVGNTLKIPSEAIGMRIRDVYLVGDDQNGQNAGFCNVPRLTPTQAAEMGASYTAYGG